MPKLPNPADPTLAAADAALVAGQDRYKRKYLGMSGIGDPCERRLWLGFRHARTASFDAPTLKRFEDGHRTEDLVIARIRKVEGLEVHDRGPDGRQLGAKLLGGHFAGHYDFMALGLIQAPKAWHVGEVKCSEKVADLEKYKAQLGEKNALQAWSEVYYGQAVMYCDCEGVDRHWLIAATPGGRAWTSVRTNADPAHAMRLKAKAERIIFSDTAPPKLGDATHWQCRMCDNAGLCHGNELPERSCRNCVHATPERDGDARWSCAVQEFGTVCEAHRFLPSMLNGEQIDVAPGDVVVYRMANGTEWRDGGQSLLQ